MDGNSYQERRIGFRNAIQAGAMTNRTWPIRLERRRGGGVAAAASRRSSQQFEEDRLRQRRKLDYLKRRRLLSGGGRERSRGERGRRPAAQARAPRAVCGRSTIEAERRPSIGLRSSVLCPTCSRNRAIQWAVLAGCPVLRPGRARSSQPAQHPPIQVVMQLLMSSKRVGELGGSRSSGMASGREFHRWSYCSDDVKGWR